MAAYAARKYLANFRFDECWSVHMFTTIAKGAKCCESIENVLANVTSSLTARGVSNADSSVLADESPIALGGKAKGHSPDTSEPPPDTMQQTKTDATNLSMANRHTVSARKIGEVGGSVGVAVAAVVVAGVVGGRRSSSSSSSRSR